LLRGGDAGTRLVPPAATQQRLRGGRVLDREARRTLDTRCRDEIVRFACELLGSVVVAAPLREQCAFCEGKDLSLARAMRGATCRGRGKNVVRPVVLAEQEQRRSL